MKKSLLLLMFLYIEILRSTTDAIQTQRAGHINLDLPSRLPLIIADRLMTSKIVVNKPTVTKYGHQ